MTNRQLCVVRNVILHILANIGEIIMTTLAQIRAKLLEQDNNQNRGQTDLAIFPFWGAKENTESVVRFLPDGDASNTFFWAERQMIKLPFPSIKNQKDVKPVVVTVPCMEMYGETCPILTEIRPWFKDKSLEDTARSYWKKRSYLFQGFVVEDGVKEEEKPDNPIRRFIIAPQLFQIIKAALLDPEMDNLPTDYVNGTDFRICKTVKGSGSSEFADYATSKWSRRERALSNEELNAIKEYGLFTLHDFLPKKPSDIEVRVIKEMFEASVNGEAYDADAWGAYFRPFGLDTSSLTTSPEVVESTVTPLSTVRKAASVVEEDEDDVPTASVTAEVKVPESAADILNVIRARKKAVS